MRRGLWSVDHRWVAIAVGNPLKGIAMQVRANAVLGLLIGVLVLAFAGCGGDHHSNEIDVTVSLIGEQEVPPVRTGASGSVALEIDPGKPGIAYTLVVAGPFTSPITQAHIHVGAIGVVGPIVLFFCTNLTPPAGVPTPPPVPCERRDGNGHLDPGPSHPSPRGGGYDL